MLTFSDLHFPKFLFGGKCARFPNFTVIISLVKLAWGEELKMQSKTMWSSYLWSRKLKLHQLIHVIVFQVTQSPSVSCESRKVESNPLTKIVLVFFLHFWCYPFSTGFKPSLLFFEKKASFTNIILKPSIQVHILWVF